jgi:hypothetical protein
VLDLLLKVRITQPSISESSEIENSTPTVASLAEISAFSSNSFQPTKIGACVSAA